MKLWSELSAPWRACLEEACVSYCAGSWPIGAAIADASGRVVARGRNVRFESGEHAHALAGSPVGHAEMVALGSLKRQPPLKGHVMYSTMEPCPMCSGAILISFMDELRFASRDPFGGASRMLTRPGNTRVHACRVVGPQSARLEAALVALATEMARRAIQAGQRDYVELWARASKVGFELGSSKRFQDEMAGFRRRRGSPEEMLESVERLLPG